MLLLNAFVPVQLLLITNKVNSTVQYAQILVVTRYLIHCNGNENSTTYNIILNNLKAFKDIYSYII